MNEPTLNSKVVKEIVEKTNSAKGMFSQRVFKDTLRFLINTFGKTYFIDRNNNVVEVKCYHANQERAVAKATNGDNITLPVITISEESSEDSNDRRKYSPMLLHEKYWHKIAQRAVRTLSLAPIPININYSINVWSKYREDMDQIREYIFAIFNPDLEIQTKFNDVTKAFIVSESPIEQDEAEDSQDRVLKKSITIKVETYIPSPKFLYTSTGKIEKLAYEINGLGTNLQVCHDITCTCTDCLLPLVLADGTLSNTPVNYEAISVIVDGT